MKFSKKELNSMCTAYDNLYDILKLDMNKKHKESLEKTSDILLNLAKSQGKTFATTYNSPNKFKVFNEVD